MRNPPIHTPVACVLLALGYFATGRLGLMLPALGHHITLVWLPTGIAVAALLRWGWRCWPGITLGAIAVNATTGTPWLMALAIAAGNTLGPLLAAWLLQRMHFHPAFDRKRDILLLAAAAIPGMLITASLGTATLSRAAMLPEGWPAAWLIWWAGDTMGVITGAPLVLTLGPAEHDRVAHRRGEFLSWLVITALMAWCVFQLDRSASGYSWALASLPLPMVAWAALRFGAAGTSFAIIVLSFGAAYSTASAHGTFPHEHPLEAVLQLWLYLVTTAVLGWLISALHTAQSKATNTQQLFEQALGDVSLGVLLAGLDRRMTYANEGFTRLTGYTEAEILGRSCSLLHGPETDPETVGRLKAALQGDGHFEGEILNYRKEGQPFWNGLLISPVRDNRGTMTGFLGIQRDITERRRVALALREGEERFRRLIELAPEAIVLLDVEAGRIVQANPAAERLFQYSAAKLCQLGPVELSPPIQPDGRASSEKAAAIIAEALAGGTPVFEWTHRNALGRDFPCEVRLLSFELGGRMVVRGTITDITERKRLEQEREQYLKFFRLSTEPMCIADPFGCFEHVNPAFLRLTGYSERELVARPYLDFILEDDRQRTLDEMKLQVAAQPSLQFENRYVCKDGRLVLLSWTAIFDRSEGVTYATARDITQLRQAELALQEALNRLQKIASQVPGVIYQYRLRPDGTSCFPFASEAMREVYRVTPEEVRDDASKVLDLLHPEDRDVVIASILQSARDLTPWRQEYRVHFPDGTERWHFGNSLPHREPDGSTVWHGFITDITERRQAQFERAQLDRKVQETQKLESLGVLAGGIAHDFNNLLTSVLGHASIAALDAPPGSSTHECLEQINEAALRAADLCKQMLAYSGRGRFVVQKLDLGILVEQTAQMLQISISKKAVLRFRLEKNLPAIEADATQIRQVIMNLVINASEAIGDTSGVISLSTGLTRVDRDYLRGTLMDPDLPVGDYVYLEVSDSGCGMSAETQARIFDPFFTMKFTGRGLGLAAVLGIVRGHQGALKVYSELERGTTFKLLFPAASGTTDTSRKPPASAQQWRTQGTVLVADDEETLRSTTSRMLQLVGLEAVLAHDGAEAVEIFRADPGRFTFVLLDLTMPHLDGEQTFTELRRIRPDVRVVLMSGFNAQEVLVRFSGKGLASFVQKPFTFDGLRNVIRGVLG